MFNLLRSSTRSSGSISIRHFSITRRVYQQDATETELLSKIKNQLKDAMRSKDTASAGVIRSLLSDHQYALKTQSKTPPSLISIIKKSISRRNEALLQFRTAKPPREDLAEKEEKEVEILNQFLPGQLSKDQIVEVVEGSLEELKEVIKGEEKVGKVVGMVLKKTMEKIDKNSVDGGEVSKIVKDLLEKRK